MPNGPAPHAMERGRPAPAVHPLRMAGARYTRRCRDPRRRWRRTCPAPRRIRRGASPEALATAGFALARGMMQPPAAPVVPAWTALRPPRMALSKSGAWPNPQPEGKLRRLALSLVPALALLAGCDITSSSAGLIRLRDNCDPATFNAALGAGSCQHASS